MSKWYWSNGGAHEGPVTSAELKELATTGQVRSSTLVWKEGAANWVAASSVKGLLPPNSESRPPLLPESPPARETPSTRLDAAKAHAATLLRDIQTLNWRDEIVPLDEANLAPLLKDYVFWCVALLGVVPLLLRTIQNESYQITAFALFFAFLWGVVFKYFVVRSSAGWRILVASLFFTGTIGLGTQLSLLRQILSDATILSVVQGDISILFMFLLAFPEELCKAVPAILYVLWTRRRIDPSSAILVGVFSGLGFAAFENVGYARLFIEGSAAMAATGAEAVAGEVQTVILDSMLRALSLVFCHAVWTGIVAYFLVVGSVTPRRLIPLLVMGIGVSTFLHGIYNWLMLIQPTFAAGVAAGAFLLFYAYVQRLRQLALPATDTGMNLEPERSSPPARAMQAGP